MGVGLRGLAIAAADVALSSVGGGETGVLVVAIGEEGKAVGG